MSTPERGADAGDLVRRDLLAVAGPAENDPAGLRVGRDSLRGPQHVDGVVVLGVIRQGAVVDHVVTRRAQVGDQGPL